MNTEADKYTFTAKNERLVFIDVYVRCTKCKRIVPMSEVGMRNTPSTTRNQPQCMECRANKKPN